MSERQKRQRGIRFDNELWDRVQKEADDRDVPCQWLVERLVKEGLENLVPAEGFVLTRRTDA